MRLPPATSRVVTAEEMIAIDRAAIARGVPSLTLMERAGKEAARRIVAWWRLADGGGRTRTSAPAGRTPRTATRATRASGPVLILCGRGNNAGDGFVAARHLKAAGFPVRALVASSEDSLSADARAQYESCARARIPVTFLPDARAWGPGSEAADAASQAAFLVDALLGTGSKGAPRGAIAAAIELAVASGKPIASIDIPSGVDASTGHVEIPAIRADVTVTLALPKVGIRLEPGREHAGVV